MASLDDDDIRYLLPTFDPSSLTVPRLRNALMSHEIKFPPSAKKPQLIDIFTQELKPKAHKILTARDKVRRTSRGIMDMPGSQEEVVNGSSTQDLGSMLPPPTSRQRKSKNSTPVVAETAMLHTSAVNDVSSSRTSSSKHARQSDSETDRDTDPKRPFVRKSHQSDTHPQIIAEKLQHTLVRPPIRGGAFSDENPFQSGSSPLDAGEHRQRTTGSSSGKCKSSSGKLKRDSAVSSTAQQQEGIVPPKSKTFQFPVSGRKQLATHDLRNNSIEAGESFTPEEQLDLVRERAAQGKHDMLPPRGTKRTQKAGAVPRSAPWVVLIALLGGYATWWRQEQLTVGYCGIGRPSYAQIPKQASALWPTCQPCPQHAICYENMETVCEDDFMLRLHPISLRGLVPLPPTCEPDGEKVRKVKIVADRGVDELREIKAQAECGVASDSTGKIVEEDVTAQDLQKMISNKRRRGMSDAEFDDLWRGAVVEIKGRDEIEVSSHGTHLRSTSLARLPVTCAIRRSARLTLARYRLSISLVAVSVMGLLYLRYIISASRSDTARVPALVAAALDRLATQAARFPRGETGESWISVGQLRDDVLRDEFSDTRRASIWKRVEAVVERNANVRASVREGRGGDMSRVWEWIGSVELIEEPWSSGRSSDHRERVSFGGPVTEVTSDGPTVPYGAEAMQRKWDEGRPVY